MGKEPRRCIAPIQVWEDYVPDEVKSITSPLQKNVHLAKYYCE
jgi:hypothetical protein